MKKTVKMILSLVLTLVIAFSYGNIVKADSDDDTNYIIKITKDSDDTAEHTYEAYQVFAGTIWGSGNDASLTDIIWGDGVNGDELLAELQKDAKYAACTNASDVAAVVATFTETDRADLESFSNAVAKNLSDKKTEVSSAAKEVSITVMGAGYYFVKDKDYSLEDLTGSYTNYILKVVDNVNVNAKADVPTINKVIDKDGGIKVNTASIGEEIPFRLTSKVPDMTGYDKYFFIISDTLDKGLTFNPETVEITVGSTKLANNAYEIKGSNPYRIVFKNFINYKNNSGEDIVVKYKATLNENADITNANKNKVNLTFSNDPNATYTGENEPESNDPMGKTPDSVTKTYTTQLKVIKTDSKDTSKKLEGAKFQITGEKMVIVVINSKVYEKASDGTWYMLKDGTFTENASASNKASDDKYKLVTKISGKPTIGSINNVAYTDKNGEIIFTGLNAGTYEITELEAPEQYNKLTEPIKVEITSNLTGEKTQETASYSFDVGAGTNATVEGNTIVISIGNNKGIQLPGTGGIGTTIFYIIGGILVAVAVVLFVTKKRVDAKEK